MRELGKFRYSSRPAPELDRRYRGRLFVSGGSVIAAHFALYGPTGLDRFAPDFLVPDNTRTLGLDAVNPITWLQLAITGSSRIDVVEELFDRQLFKGKTFYELNQPGRPYLILNATDMASGEVFAFTPKRFDDICSTSTKSRSPPAWPLIRGPDRAFAGRLSEFLRQVLPGLADAAMDHDETRRPLRPLPQSRTFQLADTQMICGMERTVRKIDYLYF